MMDGEFAVLFANEQPPEMDGSAGPVCAIFGSFAEAERYAREQTALWPRMRCSIYDHQGMGQAPLAVIAGEKAQDRSFLSANFRRWVGGVCFVLGVVLGVVEWRSDFSLSWPGMLGSRIGPAGAILLLTEAGVVMTARWKERQR